MKEHLQSTDKIEEQQSVWLNGLKSPTKLYGNCPITLLKVILSGLDNR